LWRWTSTATVPARRLTGGRRRLLELAMALALRPRMILLDALLAGLTPPFSGREMIFRAGHERRNNPSGVIYPASACVEIERVLARAAQPIVLVSDGPYKALVFDERGAARGVSVLEQPGSAALIDRFAHAVPRTPRARSTSPSAPSTASQS
jgi:ABC-type molybdate transport system ATPase subunit